MLSNPAQVPHGHFKVSKTTVAQGKIIQQSGVLPLFFQLLLQGIKILLNSTGLNGVPFIRRRQKHIIQVAGVASNNAFQGSTPDLINKCLNDSVFQVQNIMKTAGGIFHHTADQRFKLQFSDLLYQFLDMTEGRKKVIPRHSVLMKNGKQPQELLIISSMFFTTFFRCRVNHLLSSERAENFCGD